jgi:uncharacterized protein YjaZ
MDDDTKINNMTPEKKAKELLQKFKREIEFNCQPSLVPMVAQKNAMIAAQEVMDLLIKQADKGTPYTLLAEIQFWQKVKTEIANSVVS